LASEWPALLGAKREILAPPPGLDARFCGCNSSSCSFLRASARLCSTGHFIGESDGPLYLKHGAAALVAVCRTNFRRNGLGNGYGPVYTWCIGMARACSFGLFGGQGVPGGQRRRAAWDPTPAGGRRVEKAGRGCISSTFVAFGILDCASPPARGILLPFRGLLKTRVGLGSFGFFGLASTEFAGL